MNEFGSITKYKNKLDQNFFFRLKTLISFKLKLKKINSSIDKKSFSVLNEQYKDVAPDPGYSKYLNYPFWTMRNLWHVYILGIQRSNPISILDIGTGAGYFPYICSKLGHNVIATDIDTDPMFNDLIDFLNVKRVINEIKANEPLPKFGVKFDLVTGFMVCFNGHTTTHLWTSAEWDFFLKDLCQNHCNAGAEIYFTLNAERDTNLWYTEELYGYFLKTGAEIDGERIYYKSIQYFLA